MAKKPVGEIRTGVVVSTGDVLVALSLETAQTLALGPFNPHIITLPWLVKNKICEDEEVELHYLPMRQGSAFQFKDVQWQIDFQTLMVASTKKNCGELVAQVIAKLHHTPVRAVGNNFNYAGAMEQGRSSPLPMLGTKGWDAFADVGMVDQLRWTGVFFRDAVRMEITLGQSEAGIVALFNFHRETKSSEEARAAAGQFEQDRATSRELLERLFQQEIVP